MRFRDEVIRVNDDGAEQRQDVMELERKQLAMKTLGLSLAEGKAILQACKTSWPPNKLAKISSAAVIVRTPVGDTPAKQPGRAPSKPCSGQSPYPTPMAAVFVSDGGPEDLPAHSPVAERTDESRTLLSRGEVGLVNSLREGG
jgi:hypothetical protein